LGINKEKSLLGKVCGEAGENAHITMGLSVSALLGEKGNLEQPGKSVPGFGERPPRKGHQGTIGKPVKKRGKGKDLLSTGSTIKKGRMLTGLGSKRKGAEKNSVEKLNRAARFLLVWGFWGGGGGGGPQARRITCFLMEYTRPENLKKRKAKTIYRPAERSRRKTAAEL